MSKSETKQDHNQNFSLFAVYTFLYTTLPGYIFYFLYKIVYDIFAACYLMGCVYTVERRETQQDKGNWRGPNLEILD